MKKRKPKALSGHNYFFWAPPGEDAVTGLSAPIPRPPAGACGISASIPGAPGDAGCLK
jgi:hypothetical protein